MGEFTSLDVSQRFTVGQLLNQRDKIETNIQSVIDMATVNDISHGLVWYQVAHTVAYNLAIEYSRSLSSIAGIIAALSPGCQWTRNIFDTISVLENGSNAITATYGPNKNKAVTIDMGNAPLDILGGHKTRSFYHNMLSPHRDNHVTIDRHAARAGCDWHKEYTPQKFTKTNKYYVLKDAYHSIARQEKMLGHQTQAIAWLTYKRLYVNKSDGFYQLPDYVYNPLPNVTDSNYLSVIGHLAHENTTGGK